MDDILSINQFNQPDILNIFCDASTKDYTACYGVVGVVCDKEIDELYRIVTDTTSVDAEIRGMRAAIDMAIMCRNQFRILNIFCDSETSVLGVRDRFETWTVKDGILKGKSNQIIKSQEVYLEISHSILRYDCPINIFQQKGHVNPNGNTSGVDTFFKNKNRLNRQVDPELIKFISKWNDIVDVETKRILSEFDYNTRYTCPIVFYPENYNRFHYKALMNLNNGEF